MKEYTLITGASSGIGLAFARLLANKQHNLILVARNENKLKQIKKELEIAHPIDVVVIPKDLSHPQSPKGLYNQTIHHELKVTTLINNAGIASHGDFIKADWAKQRAMIQLNLTTLSELSYWFGQEMAAEGNGQILNVSSLAGFLPGPKMSVYYASKAYVLSFSQGLAEELRSKGIFVTTLCPGPTNTNFTKAGEVESRAFENESDLPTAAEVARYGWRALQKGRVIAVPGWKNKLYIFLIRFAPRWLLRKAAKYANQ